jgi:thioredoxin 1
VRLAAAAECHATQERGEFMAGKNVLEFTSDNWQKEVEQSDQPVVVDFWAPWCGPCRALGPTIEKLADQFAGRVKVGKLNVDDAPDVATKFAITSIPRIFIFKGGDKPRERITGARSEAELVSAINKVLES